MRRKLFLGLLLCLPLAAGDLPARQITYRTYFDKVYGGWLGKISGLALGVPKEFSEPWPPSNIDYFAEIPDHFSDLYSGDDLYLALRRNLTERKQAWV